MKIPQISGHSTLKLKEKVEQFVPSFRMGKLWEKDG